MVERIALHRSGILPGNHPTPPVNSIDLVSKNVVSHPSRRFHSNGVNRALDGLRDAA